jgi:hypothetical protein
MKRTTDLALRRSRPPATSYFDPPPARGGRAGTVALATLIMALGMVTGGLCVSKMVGLLPEALLDSRIDVLLVIEAVQGVFAAMAGLLVARRATIGSGVAGGRAYVWTGAGPVVLMLVITVIPALIGPFPWWRVLLDVAVVAICVTLASWLSTRHGNE